MNPDSSAGIYITASVEAECRMIAQNRKTQEEEKKRPKKLNAFKNSAHVTKCGIKNSLQQQPTYPATRRLQRTPSTPPLQVLRSLSTDTIKDTFYHLDGKIGELSDQKKRTWRRLCGSGGGASWEAVRVFCENTMFLDTLERNEVLI